MFVVSFGAEMRTFVTVNCVCEPRAHHSSGKISINRVRIGRDLDLSPHEVREIQVAEPKVGV